MIGKLLAKTALLFVLFALPAFAQTKLLRFPDVYNDRVVFSYASDLWTTSTSGGTAVRLTSHPGMEVFGKFSPDGKYIAFTGQYDGDEQVYVIPSGGGEPKQLTFYPAKGPFAPRWGYDNQVLGWTNDGTSIVFRSQRDSYTLPVSKLYTVPMTGGMPTALPMPEAGSGDFSPDGRRMVYSPRTRDFRSEKRYGGGQANTLYIYDLATNDAKKISEGVRPWRDAMWLGDKIYFNSDKDGKFNLYAYDVASGKTAAATNFKDWDVRWASSDEKNQVIYERNSELEILDTKNNKAQKLNINVPDDGVYKRPRTVNAMAVFENVALSPKGERVLFGARGDIFSVPVEKGATRNLTHSSNAHDKYPRWSPDGSRIAFISDRSGEDEVWIAAQDGMSAAVQLTNGGVTPAQRYSPEWSGDGKRLAFSDKDGKIFIYTFADKSLKQIVDAANGQINDYEWSPKGNYLAFSMNDKAASNNGGYNSVYVYDVLNNKLIRVTDPMFNSQNPTFDPSGDYLYYLSDREFAPQISDKEFNFAGNRSTMIYALALRKDVKNPFPPESDEVTIASAPKPNDKDELTPPNDPNTAPTDEKQPQPTASASPSPSPTGTPNPNAAKKNVVAQKPETIDFDGITRRVTRVPIAADNYGGLTAKTGHLVYFVGSAFYYGRQSDQPNKVKIFSIKDRKETVLMDAANSYSLSSDGSKIIIGANGGFSVMDATPGGASGKKTVSTAGMTVEINPTEEWNQIFNEVWRRYRDWFYVSNMHGFDWVKIRDEYKTWLPYVAHRSDLNYVISEMISELATQHSYIEGGDYNTPPRIRVALPGARFEIDKAANRYKISKIYEGENEEELYRSPLMEVGVNAKVGDYILQINGENVTADRDIYAYLRGKADAPVVLTVNSTPSLNGARQISYRPTTDETNLIYLDWVTANRNRVTQMTNGKVGYIHIPDMGAAGIREFIKWYYPQLDKEGMIVDVRANGGGNISRMIIERLRRKALAVNFSRTNDSATTYPDAAAPNAMVSILNENSASDGDIFPYMFRQAGLGTLIGKRSWGGVVGITNHGTLIDGGTVNVPEFGLVNLEGKWVIEGYGVDPDIEVENDPKSVIAGGDPQLERAIQEVTKKMGSAPMKLPNRPPAPNKAGNQ
ncbi:MAG: S41 family peptidase [Acidobacteriota bacterium]|nr:S41 family peptidase [Acidobacteriota bacterium]